MCQRAMYIAKPRCGRNLIVYRENERRVGKMRTEAACFTPILSGRGRNVSVENIGRRDPPNYHYHRKDNNNQNGKKKVEDIKGH